MVLARDITEREIEKNVSGGMLCSWPSIHVFTSCIMSCGIDSRTVSSTLPFCTMGRMMASLVSKRRRYASFSTANEYLVAMCYGLAWMKITRTYTKA